MDTDGSKREQILKILQDKGVIKIKCYNHAFEYFQELKNILHETSGEINDEITNNRIIKMEYRDKGKFEAQLQFGDDILIFNMHTDIFQFSDNHSVCKTPYAKISENNTLCAVINVYNFLTNSFKYNRESDEGYLIGRIFINHENYFFVEGKNMDKYNSSTFGTQEINEKTTVDIIETMVLYTLGFDLLVPQYDTIKVIDSDKMNNKIDNSKTDTGKRLYMDFDISDIAL